MPRKRSSKKGPGKLKGTRPKAKRKRGKGKPVKKEPKVFQPKSPSDYTWKYIKRLQKNYPLPTDEQMASWGTKITAAQQAAKAIVDPNLSPVKAGKILQRLRDPTLPAARREGLLKQLRNPKISTRDRIFHEFILRSGESREAVDQLIKHHLRWGVSIANKFNNTAIANVLPLDDRIQAASLGIVGNSTQWPSIASRSLAS